ncbi:MAG: L-threonylcarbamoyladenylate synthase [Candidatus Peregrinibacteria bacterium]|nr:L-threonylcarbamoyladenylate synthase [Candidatus Peregrinibacteria bacterium]
MKVLQCNSDAVCAETIQAAVAVLRGGGIVANPTDTCYGLAADPFNEKGLKKLYAIKGMPEDKPVSILVRSLEEAKKYGYFSDMAIRMAVDFWPGSLTLVVPRTDLLPDYFNSDSDTVGIRVINEPVTLALLEAFDGPLTTTSANKHGKPCAYTFDEITATADLVIDVGELTYRQKPSTIIQIDGERATMIRQGDLLLDLHGPS